jgi:hypothetical protein
VSRSERAWWLGDSRWPVAGVIALVGAAVSAVGRMWLAAGLFFAAALALAVVTLRTARR